MKSIEGLKFFKFNEYDEIQSVEIYIKFHICFYDNSFLKFNIQVKTSLSIAPWDSLDLSHTGTDGETQRTPTSPLVGKRPTISSLKNKKAFYNCFGKQENISIYIYGPMKGSCIKRRINFNFLCVFFTP